MSNIQSVPERFSDLSGAADCQKFRNSLLLMRKVASAARERFAGWHAQHENGVSSVVRFTENADEFLSMMKKRIEGEIREGREFGRKIDREGLKARMRREIEGMVSGGIYRLQYELACMRLPPGASNGAPDHGISEMFRASSDSSPELGAFLESVNVRGHEFNDAVSTLRDFFLSKGRTNAEIKEDKARVSVAIISFMESYLEFRLGPSPMEEGIVK